MIVHTGFPHYPAGKIAAPYRNRPLLLEDRDGIRVVRSAVLPAANRGTVRRLLDHSVFAASALATSPAAGRAEVVLAESPPLFLAGAAVPYARLLGARLVLHVADLWPESAIALGALKGSAAIGAARRLEQMAYRHADLIVGPTRGIVESIGARAEGRGKTLLIEPSVDLEQFDVPPIRREGPLRVLYAGTVGMAQNVGSLVEAAALAGPERVAVTIAGDGAELAAVKARAAALANVSVLGAVAADAVPNLYAEADAAAVTLRGVPLFDGAVPSKLLEGFAAGRPVVLAAVGESAEVVRACGGGVVVPPDDPSALAAALADLAALPTEDLAAMGERGHDLAEGRRREVAVGEWLRALQAL